MPLRPSECSMTRSSASVLSLVENSGGSSYAELILARFGGNAFDLSASPWQGTDQARTFSTDLPTLPSAAYHVLRPFSTSFFALVTFFCSS